MEKSAKNIRNSKKRDAVLEVLKNTKLHPSAEWIWSQLRMQFPDLSLATVYRNLAYFKERGEVISVGIVNGQERFDYNVHPHTHFVCRHCHKIIDIGSITFDNKYNDLLSSEYAVIPEFYELTFYGICQNCLNKSNKE